MAGQCTPNRTDDLANPLRILQQGRAAIVAIHGWRRASEVDIDRGRAGFVVKHVPAVIRNRDREIGRGNPDLTRYERIAFEKNLIGPPGKPLAAFVCPGHPLLDATLDLVIERHRDLLKRGAILIDESDESDQPRALLYL
jgi:hypothetical protein